MPRKRRHRYWLRAGGIALFLLLLVVELWLRLAFGLGNPALLQADPHIGYRYQPNQDLVRFGKRIAYNQYSQRSDPVTLDKPPGRLRILMVGDSVLNGGNPIDQSQTITELLEQQLTAAGQAAEVLNASAGSWGPGNEWAYLQQFGLFNSDAVILQVGANDLAQPTSVSSRVGHDPNFPDRKPLLALQDALVRYGWPLVQRYLLRLVPLSEIPVAQNPARQFQENQGYWEAIATFLRTQQRPLFVLFIPRYYEVIPGFSDPPFKREFLQQLERLRLPVVDVHRAWGQLPANQVIPYFRDSDHLTVAGNQAVVALLYQELCERGQLKPCVSRK
jgi:lysophospholipase L1-like esterase